MALLQIITYENMMPVRSSFVTVSKLDILV